MCTHTGHLYSFTVKYELPVTLLPGTAQGARTKGVGPAGLCGEGDLVGVSGILGQLVPSTLALSEFCLLAHL